MDNYNLFFLKSYLLLNLNEKTIRIQNTKFHLKINNNKFNEMNIIQNKLVCFIISIKSASFTKKKKLN
jgi:hypothetical protein